MLFVVADFVFFICGCFVFAFITKSIPIKKDVWAGLGEEDRLG